VDKLAQVNGIVINNLVFDVKDKTTFLDTARERAFNQAKRKADDYAGLLSLTVRRLLSVVDDVNSAPVVQELQQNVAFAAARGSDASQQQTNINLGTIDISYNL